MGRGEGGGSEMPFSPDRLRHLLLDLVRVEGAYEGVAHRSALCPLVLSPAHQAARVVVLMLCPWTSYIARTCVNPPVRSVLELFARWP